MARGFVDALKQHSAEVATLEGDQATEFLRLLKQLREELSGRLTAAYNAGDDLNAFMVQRILAETETGISTLEAKAKGQYGDASREAVDLSIDHLSEELDRLSRAFDAKPAEVVLDAAKVLADPGQQLLANHFDTSVRRYGLDLLNGVRQRVFVGLRAGDSVGDVVGDMAGLRGPLGTIGQASGERLVRTEIGQAYGSAQHSAVHQAAKQVPGLKKVWLHVGSYLCPVCGPLHGTERPLDGTWTLRVGKRTREVAHAPGHPNCTCRVSAMKSSWRDGLKEQGYLGKQDDSGERGRAAL